MTSMSRASARSMPVPKPAPTTAFVLGLDGLAWVADHAGYGALAITNDDRVIWTPHRRGASGP